MKTNTKENIQQFKTDIHKMRSDLATIRSHFEFIIEDTNFKGSNKFITGMFTGLIVCLSNFLSEIEKSGNKIYRE